MRWLTNVRLPHPFLTTSSSNIWKVQLNEHEIVQSVVPVSSQHQTENSAEDWGGDFLSPMGLDLQMNGGLGLAFPELTSKNLSNLFALLDSLWKDGVEAISPTFVSCSITSLQEALFVLRAARKEHCKNRCELLGAHLEGPFLSKNFIGAHNDEYITNPSLDALAKRIRGFENEIALMTLAPELNGSMQLIKHLRELGIVVALGHSAADEEISNLAFKKGVSMLTHTFNAMNALHHRAPGPIGAAISNDNISLGLIADGVHVDPKVAVLIQKLAPERLVLVSDAIAPYGLKNGKYQWNERFVSSEDGTCRLENGTLAGTTLSLLDGCIRLAKWSENAGAAIWSATIAPRRVLSGDSLKVERYLIGKSLTQLLRWETNLKSKQLFWRFAL